MTKIIEITNCGKCPFCNNDNEYGMDQCNLSYCVYVKSDIVSDLSRNTIHKDCPLKKEEVIVRIKTETNPTLADLDHRDVIGHGI
jgi:hypothetical protein